MASVLVWEGPEVTVTTPLEVEEGGLEARTAYVSKRSETHACLQLRRKGDRLQRTVLRLNRE